MGTHRFPLTTDGLNLMGLVTANLTDNQLKADVSSQQVYQLAFVCVYILTGCFTTSRRKV